MQLAAARSGSLMLSCAQHSYRPVSVKVPLPLCLLERLKDKFIPWISQSSLRAPWMVSPAAGGFQQSLQQPENRRAAEQCYSCPFLSGLQRDRQLYTAQRLSFWKGLLALAHSFPLQELGWETLCFSPRAWPGEALCTFVWLLMELNIVFIYFSLS